LLRTAFLIFFFPAGILNGAPVDELRACGSCNCPQPPSCDFCQYGMNGYLCRPNTTIWCVGCPGSGGTTAATTSGTGTTPPVCTNNCSGCIFAGPGNSKLCVPVTITQDVGQSVGVQGTSSDKLITVNIVSVFSKSWVDGLSALADAGGADTFVFESLNGVPIAPVPSAFAQVNYNAALLQSSNIVWSASLQNETVAENEATLAGLLAQGLQGRWRSQTNLELGGAGFVLPLLAQGSVRDLTQLPVLPLTEFSGVCKTNMCTARPSNVVVPVNVIPIRN
jgi:hypothetical protein